MLEGLAVVEGVDDVDHLARLLHHARLGRVARLVGARLAFAQGTRAGKEAGRDHETCARER